MMAQTIAQIEYDNPGIFETLTSKSADAATQQAARDRIQRQLDPSFEAVDHGFPSTPGALIGDGLATDRVSAVNETLSKKYRRYRAAVLATAGGLPQGWVVHHKVPFEVVAQMPYDHQMSLVFGGWGMDNPDNLVALPRDEPSY